MTLSVLTFFSGLRIEVGKFCNTEVPCRPVVDAVYGYCVLVTGTR